MTDNDSTGDATPVGPQHVSDDELSDLTAEEIERAEATLTIAANPDAKWKLVRAELDGNDVALLAFIDPEDGGLYVTAVLIDDAMLGRLAIPGTWTEPGSENPDVINLT